MKQKSFLVLAAITAVLLLSGCPALLDIVNDNTSTTTTTTLTPSTTTTTISTTTTTLSELESRTLSDAAAASGYNDKLPVVSNGRQYVIQNNIIMSPSTQIVEYSTESGNFVIKEHSGSSIPGLVSFPSIFIGNNNGHATTDSNLPVKNSSILSIPTTWTWSDSGATTPDFLALYELWFTSSAEENILGPEKSLKIWMFKPSSHDPSGSVIGSAVIEGKTWTIWSDGANITYVAASRLSSVNFNLNEFVSDAFPRTTISNSDYLHDVIAGFKIWSGGAGLSTSGFSAVVK